MKKLLCGLLAVLMVCSLFLFSCSKDPKTTGGAPNTPPATNDNSDVFDAPIKKLNRTLTIARRNNTSSPHLSCNEFYAESYGKDAISNAVFSRNAQLEEKFGITVVEDPVASPTVAYKDTLIAGDYVADLFAHDIYSLRTLANSNLLVDWASLSTVNLEKAWWNKTMADNITIAGKSFFVNGDAMTLDDRGTWVLFFNQDLIKDAGLESPYTLVKNGTWTVEKMYEYMVKASKDMDGDGKKETYKTDIVGYIGEKFNNWVHVAAGNISLSERTADGALVLPDQPSRQLVDAWGKIKNVLATSHRYVGSDGTSFRNGLGVFYGCNLGALTLFPDSAINFGVIPFPKVFEDQDGYYTAGSPGNTGCLVLPATVEQDERADWTANGFSSAAEQVGYMAEALSYLSMDTLTLAFYDQVLKKQTVRDQESADNLALVLDTDHIIMDPVILFNFGNIGYSLFYDGTPNVNVLANDLTWENVISAYGERLTAARTALKDYEIITQ